MVSNNSPLEFLTAFAIVFISGVLFAVSVIHWSSKHRYCRHEVHPAHD